MHDLVMKGLNLRDKRFGAENLIMDFLRDTKSFQDAWSSQLQLMIESDFLHRIGFERANPDFSITN